MLSEAVQSFLAEPRFAVVATVSRDGAPQQTVMWYELQGDVVMMNTGVGRVKAGNLRRDPRMSICIEDGYRYVTIAGRAELIDDQEIAQADIAHLAIRYHGEEQGRAMAADFQRQQRVTIRLAIESVVTNGF